LNLPSLWRIESRMSHERRKVRTAEPERRQGVIRFELPEEALPIDHPARVLARVIDTLDLTAFTEDAKAVEGRAGRSLSSPSMLLALWTYAVSRGIGSAREIARLTRRDDAFRWIVGDQKIGHDTLSRFRVGHRRALESLMTQVLGVLLDKRLLSLEVVAQDGTRLRASASAPSFRSKQGLEDCREQARLHVAAVMAEADDPELSQRQRRARLAAAQAVAARVDEAIEAVRTLETEGKDKPRASTTDPEARVMKMGDGGFRPAYNAQLAVAGAPEGGPRTIVGVRVTNVGSDQSSLRPMLRTIAQKTGALPRALLADANHGTNECIRALMRAGVTPLVSVHKRARAPEDAELSAWHALMKTAAAKRLYRARAGLVELTNAHLKRFGLDQLLVRGIEKVTSVVLLGALTFNLLQNARALLA
jgi:transposase